MCCFFQLFCMLRFCSARARAGRHQQITGIKPIRRCFADKPFYAYNGWILAIASHYYEYNEKQMSVKLVCGRAHSIHRCDMTWSRKHIQYNILEYVIWSFLLFCFRLCLSACANGDVQPPTGLTAKTSWCRTYYSHVDVLSVAAINMTGFARPVIRTFSNHWKQILLDV